MEGNKKRANNLTENASCLLQLSLSSSGDQRQERKRGRLLCHVSFQNELFMECTEKFYPLLALFGSEETHSRAYHFISIQRRSFCLRTFIVFIELKSLWDQVQFFLSIDQAFTLLICFDFSFLSFALFLFQQFISQRQRYSISENWTLTLCIRFLLANLIATIR